MNPVMFIPFILVQPLLAAITLTAYYPALSRPSPTLRRDHAGGSGAFFNTNGSVTAFLLAIFNLGIATLLYMPFVAIANKAATVIDEEESEEDIALALKFKIARRGATRASQKELKMLDLDSIVAEETAENDLEEVVMGLIINSGQARSWRMPRSSRPSRVISQPRNHDGTVPYGAERSAPVQTKLIESDRGEGKMKVSLVQVHAQDHLMTSMLARELVAELIELHEKMQ